MADLSIVGIANIYRLKRYQSKYINELNQYHRKTKYINKYLKKDNYVLIDIVAWKQGNYERNIKY